MLSIPISGQTPISSGSGPILQISFLSSAKAGSQESSPLLLEEALLWNLEGRPYPVTLTNGQITIQPAPTSDLGTTTTTPTVPTTPLAQKQVSLKTVTVVAGQTLTVPIEVDNASGLLAADLKLSYDPLRLAYQQATTTDLS